MSYIQFEDAGTSPSGKTKIWRVVNTQSNFVLGSVGWFSQWRKYIFAPGAGSMYDHKCLREIADFTELQTQLHKGK